MDHISADKKIDLIKYRHEDQVKTLRAINEMEHKRTAGFLTIQLALGGVLSKLPVAALVPRLGIFFIDLVIAVICIYLLYHTNQYRKAVAQTVKNCNKYLGYEEPGFYLDDRKINADYTFRGFYKFYFVGIIATLIGIGLILFVA